MAVDDKSLRMAWRALATASGTEGWRSIPVTTSTSCRILAGCHFPGGEEAVLVGFHHPASAAGPSLPSGHGFLVECPAIQVGDGTRHWVALTRQPSGDLDLFTAMAVDVLALLEASSAVNHNVLLRLFIGRVAAWQDFMDKERTGILGLEAEIGLFGELVMLGRLLDAGLPASAAVEGWQGPIGAPQDFLIGSGAIETKATIATVGFPATIGSLDQLDDSVRQPLFIAGVRLVAGEIGQTLPDLVTMTRTRLNNATGAIGVFNGSLLRAGYVHAFADRYGRRFTVADTRLMQVGPRFPRLVAATVPPGIRKVRYEIDLDQVATGTVELADALTSLGGLEWN